MAKRIEVKKAQPIGDQVIESVEIVIDGHYPERTKEDLNKLGWCFKKDALAIFNGLRSLPGGTFDQLLILMLQKAASSFIVPHDFHDKELAAPKMFLAIERTLEEIELSRLHSRAPHYEWIEANCRNALEAVYPNYAKAEGKEGANG